MKGKQTNSMSINRAARLMLGQTLNGRRKIDKRILSGRIRNSWSSLYSIKVLLSGTRTGLHENKLVYGFSNISLVWQTVLTVRWTCTHDSPWSRMWMNEWIILVGRMGNVHLCTREDGNNSPPLRCLTANYPCPTLLLHERRCLSAVRNTWR